MLREHDVTGTLKIWGANIMIQDCLSWSGPSAIAHIVRRMNTEQYISIQDTKVVRSMESTCLLEDMPPLQEFIFQQDEDSKHTSWGTKKYLESKKVNCMQLPTQSPDLNPIEHLQGELNIRLRLQQENPKDLGEIQVEIRTNGRRYRLVPARLSQNPCRGDLRLQSW